jgi:hypothetical protein
VSSPAAEPTPASEAPPTVPAGGFKKKTLIVIGVVTAAVWAFAIQTGSVVLMSIVGALTLLLVGVLIWAWRMSKKQQGLAGLLQGAMTSPEARREAIARLESGKDAGEVTNIVARAQLEAADDPARALETLEALEWKRVPAQMQDDVAILKSQLYLQFGRPKDARPLVDKVNVDSPQRKQMRGVMVAVVAEAWARTGKHAEALELIDTVDQAAEKDEQVRVQLVIARVFARFAAGKRGQAREDLSAIADADVNYLGRFLLPRFRVHPELQKLARAVAERHPSVRRQAAAASGQRRGRPR